MAKWEGKSGENYTITQGGWQQSLTASSAAKASFLYYGFGRTFGYLEPSSLLGIDLSSTPAVFLIGGVDNDKSYQVTMKSDNSKSPARVAAETPYRTAVLMSLRGIGA